MGKPTSDEQKKAEVSPCPFFPKIHVSLTTCVFPLNRCSRNSRTNTPRWISPTPNSPEKREGFIRFCAFFRFCRYPIFSFSFASYWFDCWVLSLSYRSYCLVNLCFVVQSSPMRFELGGAPLALPSLVHRCSQAMNQTDSKKACKERKMNKQQPPNHRKENKQSCGGNSNPQRTHPRLLPSQTKLNNQKTP